MKQFNTILKVRNFKIEVGLFFKIEVGMFRGHSQHKKQQAGMFYEKLR